MRVEFRVFGYPQPQGSKQAFAYVAKDGKPRATVVDDNKKPLKVWRDQVDTAARAALAGRPGFVAHTPLRLDLLFYLRRGKTVQREFPTTKPDFDKLTRAVADSLTTSGAIADDSNVVTSTIKKRYAWLPGREGVRVRVTVQPSLKGLVK